MNAVPNMPLPAELPAAGAKPVARREKPMDLRAEKEPADFKSTLRAVDAQERADENQEATSTRETPKPDGDDSRDGGKGDAPAPDTATEIAGSFVSDDDQPSARTEMPSVVNMAPPAEDANAGKSTGTVTVAAPSIQSGPSQPAPVTDTKLWQPSPTEAVTSPAAESDGSKPQGKQPLSADLIKPSLPGGVTSESRAASDQGQMASVTIEKLPGNRTATKPTGGDINLPDKAVNPANAVIDNLREGARPSSSATRNQTVGSDHPSTSETEGRVPTDLPRMEVEGREAGGSRSMSNDLPTAAQRMGQSLRPKFDQRPDALNAIERGAGPSMDKAAHTPTAEKAPPPSPEGFRESNLSSIVERIAVTVRGGQSEARIALKPEHLGSLRVQITTDNNMVSIKIMTEFSMARDLLESNLPQLKAELQQQGLDVEEFNVSFDEEEQQFRREERQARVVRRGRRQSGTPGEEEGQEPDTSRQGNTHASVARPSGIDYFA